MSRRSSYAVNVEEVVDDHHLYKLCAPLSADLPYVLCSIQDFCLTENSSLSPGYDDHERIEVDYLRTAFAESISSSLPGVSSYVSDPSSSVLGATSVRVALTVGDIPQAAEVSEGRRMSILHVNLSDNVDLGEIRELSTSVSARRLRLGFEYAGIYDATVRTLKPWPIGPYIVARFLNLKDLLENFQYINVPSLSLLAARHSVSLPSRSLKASIIKALYRHRCNSSCEAINVLFKALKTDRRSSARMELEDDDSVSARSQKATGKRRERNRIAQGKARALDAPPSFPGASLRSSPPSALSNECDSGPPQPISRDLRREIIEEWQTLMSADAVAQGTCGVCGYSLPKNQLCWREPDEIDFNLLRNPHLSADVIPNDYNFDAYHRAILHRLGLFDVNHLNKLRVCSQCWNSLSVKKQPRNALANFQYYAHCRLPIDVKNSIDNASQFDKLLVARCRASKITHLLRGP
ncbi:hypothetical protein BJ138DRAFT_1200608 [Hygrophoropsis aurantiaca]|uniref:Uncharacterized protein n=1 Tax=Hygrophoropsis aurantiaca TaxID=72124 RepID=A0ACB7ZP13_9AGAM|nr:hypothetical protein BJ138DRAFT_1200608 [Hygrophoropsis aurantiaca]